MEQSQMDSSQHMRVDSKRIQHQAFVVVNYKDTRLSGQELLMTVNEIRRLEAVGLWQPMTISMWLVWKDRWLHIKQTLPLSVLVIMRNVNQMTTFISQVRHQEPQKQQVMVACITAAKIMIK